MNALHKNFSKIKLEACFNRSRAKFRRAGSAGIDGVGITDFNVSLDESISDLSKSIISGNFRHQKLKSFSFEKSNGSLRWICIPTIRDRLVQRRLAEVILDKDPAKLRTSSSYGALKAIGSDAERSAVRVAAQLRSAMPWIVKSDISSFFDKLPRNNIRDSLFKFCKKKSLYHLFEQVISSEASANSDKKQAMEESGIIQGTGIRQGMPLSPLLAHISLIEFDRELERKGIKFIRYVDDLIFFGSDKESVKYSFKYAKETLFKKLELTLPEINTGKSEICSPKDSVEFLGLEIYNKKSSYRLRIPDSKFQKLEGRFNQKSHIDLNDPEDGAVLKYLAFLSSARKSYHGVYKDLDNWHSFEIKIKELERRSIRLFSKQIGQLSKQKGGFPKEVLRAFGIKP